jgi:hypothetical protein
VLVAPQLLEVALAALVADPRPPSLRLGGDPRNQVAQLAAIEIAFLVDGRPPLW